MSRGGCLRREYLESCNGIVPEWCRAQLFGGGTGGIDGTRLAVDPTSTGHCGDHIRIGELGGMRVFVTNEPDGLGGGMVAGEPIAQGGTVAQGDGGTVCHQ